MAADSVVFWSWSEGNILVASMRDPIPTPRPVALFPKLPPNRSCVDVETTVGRFILFRNECADRDGGPDVVERVLFDATEKRTVAKLEGIAGPVGLLPDGKMLTAGPEGVCPVREK
jgi:hypothetical protein